MDGSPVAAKPARAFSRALPTKVGSVLDGLVVRRHVVEAEHLDVGQVFGQDPPHLTQLLGVAGRQDDPA